MKVDIVKESEEKLVVKEVRYEDIPIVTITLKGRSEIQDFLNSLLASEVGQRLRDRVSKALKA